MGEREEERERENTTSITSNYQQPFGSTSSALSLF